MAILGAVLFPVLVGGMGLGAEVGYWYLAQQKLQHAADVTAFAAATRLAAGGGDAELDGVGLHVASQSGYVPAQGTIAVNHPPLTGPNAGDDTMVEVVLTRQIPRFLTAAYDPSALDLQGRAVASVTGTSICLLALNTTATNALHFQGAATTNFENCSVASNSTTTSSIRTEGSPNVIASCAYASGSYRRTGPGSITTTECAAMETSHAAFPDPYGSVTFPTTTSACSPGTISGGNVATNNTLANGVPFKRFCSLSISGNVTFAPGLYIVDGAMTNSGSGTMTGSGVTFAVRANVTLSGTMTMNLSGQNSGPYSGLLFFGDRDTTIETATLTGNSGSTFQGALYFPTGNLTFTGSSKEMNGCTQIIANKVILTGSSQIRASCSGSGTKKIAGLGGSTQIVE